MNRKVTTILTILSIALSVALLVGVEHVRSGVRDSFSSTISQTDLIVGARGGVIQLLLYTVFGMGSATNNMRYDTYEELRQHPAIAWTVPYSLGDSHRGFRVIGTTPEFFEKYRYRQNRSIEFREGKRPEGIFDVVLGSEVADRLGYLLGEEIAVTHGLGGTGILDHSDKPFRVVGILERTATPVDRALYISLEGMEAIHIDWQEGAPPMPGTEVPAAEITRDRIKIKQITAFFAGAQNRIAILQLQRDINAYTGEPLMAVIPGVALSELWRGIGYAEDGLQIVTIFVVVVGLLGMLMSIYTSLNERRREMAILRAVGTGPVKIFFLLVNESAILSVLGCIVGVVLVYTLLFVSQSPVERHFGLYIPIQPMSMTEYAYLGAVILGAILLGFVPAVKAYRNSLADGLSIRV